MRIEYHCDYCGDLIGSLEMEPLDEEALGLSALTPEERANIIRVDQEHGLMLIGSVCDDCLADLGLADFGLAGSIQMPPAFRH